MIDPAIATGLARIAARERDVASAYHPGFAPESSEVAGRSRMLPSANPLSVVAPEGSYFVSPGERDSAAFSRDGTFRVVGGTLCAQDGRPVFGVPLGRGSALAALRIDPYDFAGHHATEPRVDSDGTFSYARTTVDPRSGERREERVVVGRVALARFPAGTQPERIDAVRVRAPAGVVPWVGVPADGRFPALAPRARDLGRVDIIAGIEKMNDAYRSFEALRSAHHVRGSFEKTTMELVK